VVIPRRPPSRGAGYGGSLAAIAAVLLVAVPACAGSRVSTPAPAAALGDTATAVAARLSAPTGFRARLRHDEGSTRGSFVEWRTRWELAWEPVAVAAGYRVHIASSEGGDRTREVDAPRFQLEVAAGTSSPSAVQRDRDLQLAIAASQLQVRVAAVADSDGREGAASPWFAVADAPHGGIPIPRPG
jgi:hypothetical protein